MTPSRSLTSAALISVTAAATMLLIQACGGGAVAQSADDADPAEGVWEALITVRDCSSGAAILTARGQQTLHRGGTLTDSNAAPPASRGVGMGVWQRDSAGSTNSAGYTSHFRFMRFNPDGTYAGTQRVTRSFTLSVDGKSQTSTNTSQTLDAAGTVLQNGCATDLSTRLF